MSENKRLHPITIVFQLVKMIKDAIIPLAIYGFVYIKSLRSSESAWMQSLPMLIFIGIVVFIVLSVIIHWARYTYRVEDQELRIEQGLFVRKKRYIPFDRIQSLDFSESILHRPFGLVKVKVETAGTSIDQAEAELTAIRKEEAEDLQRIIAAAKTRTLPDEEIDQPIQRVKDDAIYKITHPQLLFIASTSGRAGVLFMAILGFSSQFQDLIPFERLFDEFEQLVKAGYWLLVLIVLLGLALGWLLSVGMAYLKYSQFTVRKKEDDIIITRGLLEKRTTTIPMKRVQGVKITESPLRQPFGFASVSLETAGGSIMEQDSAGNVLFPIIKKQDIYPLLDACLDGYQFEADLVPVTKRAKWRYVTIKLAVMVLVTALLSYFLWPYGLFGVLLITCAVVWGTLEYKSAAFKASDLQLVLRYRDISQHTVYMMKSRIQSFDVTTNWFQRQADLATVKAVVMNGSGGHTSVVKHLEKGEATALYEWYRPDNTNRPE